MTDGWVLATGNAGKLREFSRILEPLGVVLTPQSELGVPEAEETGTTFVENALIKARNAAQHTGRPALADDSGLRVDALGGAPGVQSARFAGLAASDADNNRKLLDALQGVDDRSAAFHCVLVWLESVEDPTPVVVQARWPGQILEAPRGEGGFGYDPLFFVPDQGVASAELDADIKNRLSHRGQALDRLVDELRSLAPTALS